MATEKQKREVMGDDKKETNVALEKIQHSQYMSTIRQQSRGYVHAGEDTDQQPAASSTTRDKDRVWSGVVYEGEVEESEEERAVDQMLLNRDRDLSTPQGEIEETIDDP